jgi:hypothetical protein
LSCGFDAFDRASGFQFFTRLAIGIFIVAAALTLGMMMIAFGITVIVIVRVLVLGLSTPHQKHGCDDCDEL